MSGSFTYPEDAPEVRGHYDGDGCEWEFGPGVHNLGATPLRPEDAERLAAFAAELWATAPHHPAPHEKETTDDR